MKTKYGALRTISMIYKVLALIVAVVVLLVAGLGVLLAFDSSFGSRSLVTAVTWLVGGGILAVSLFATGKLLDLLIGMEENTRASRILLTRMAQVVGRGASGANQRAEPRPSSQSFVADDAPPDIDRF